EIQPDIIFDSSSMTPQSLTIPLEPTSIIVYNNGSTINRFEARLFRAEILVEVPPQSYEEILLEPQVVGTVSFRINGVNMGHLRVE
ncbi:MAG: hypothetical protein ACMXYA_03010, partial [Candidatus Woesearchaeota archaeon]